MTAAKTRCLVFSAVLLTGLAPSRAGLTLPFVGYWEGQTVSAVPTSDPAVIAVVTAGDGLAIPLGRYTMVSPHNSHLDTLAADGEQIFETECGDQVRATFTGQFTPTEDGLLEGVLHARIVGGTGPFRRASGRYTFHILFDPATFQSVAWFSGSISLR